MRSDWIILGSIAVIVVVAIATEQNVTVGPAATYSPASIPNIQPSVSATDFHPTASSSVSQLSHAPSPVSRYSGLQFNGYPCTVNCSGHEAGYEWAEEHGIDDSDDCDGKSESFIEGCRSYVEEQSSNSDEDEADD